MPQTAETTLANLRAGRERAKAAGARIGGMPPYGWRSYRGQLSPNQDEQGPLWLMRHLAGAGWSPDRIARQLDALDIAPRGRRGRQTWNPSTVRAILARGAVEPAAPVAGPLALPSG